MNCLLITLVLSLASLGPACSRAVDGNERFHRMQLMDHVFCSTFDASKCAGHDYFCFEMDPMGSGCPVGCQCRYGLATIDELLDLANHMDGLDTPRLDRNKMPQL